MNHKSAQIQAGVPTQAGKMLLQVAENAGLASAGREPGVPGGGLGDEHGTYRRKTFVGAG